MNNLYDDNKLYMPMDNVTPIIGTSKGTELMNSMLLTQYQNSTNLKEYMLAFVEEMDYLFEQLEEVYLGRFLNNAIGEQLDTIGIILNQTRAIILPSTQFGFEGAVNIEGMADEVEPNVGGYFKDENPNIGAVTSLNDISYRRVLMVKALLSNRSSIDISLAYYVISILLGRTLSTFELRDEDSGVSIEKGRVDLQVATSEVTVNELQLITYMARYFVPSGVTFTITEV